MGGKPNPGTPADRRLSENKGKGKGGGKGGPPAMPAHPRPVMRRGKRS